MRVAREQFVLLLLFYKTRLKTRKHIPKKIGMRGIKRVSFPSIFFPFFYILPTFHYTGA